MLSKEEKHKLKIFYEDMKRELERNDHKGSILEFQDFNSIIAEMEYHKAKLFIAIRVHNVQAIREYIADTANFLLALGNTLRVYESPRDNYCRELNTINTFKSVRPDEQNTNVKEITQLKQKQNAKNSR